jgi:hypothetical protein
MYYRGQSCTNIMMENGAHLHHTSPAFRLVCLNCLSKLPSDVTSQFCSMMLLVSYRPIWPIIPQYHNILALMQVTYFTHPINSVQFRSCLNK